MRFCFENASALKFLSAAFSSFCLNEAGVGNYCWRPLVTYVCNVCPFIQSFEVSMTTMPLCCSKFFESSHGLLLPKGGSPKPPHGQIMLERSWNTFQLYQYPIPSSSTLVTKALTNMNALMEKHIKNPWKTSACGYSLHDCGSKPKVVYIFRDTYHPPIVFLCLFSFFKGFSWLFTRVLTQSHLFPGSFRLQKTEAPLGIALATPARAQRSLGGRPPWWCFGVLGSCSHPT